MPEPDALIPSLFTSALFEDVSPEEGERIIAAGRRRTVDQGHYVYRQGESDCHFYIIAAGEAELTMNIDGGDQLLVSHIGTGGHFGETALLTNSAHSINVRALTDLSLLCFDAEAFNHLLLANQVIQRRLCIGLARRLRISYHDHAGALTKVKHTRRSSEHNLDSTFISGPASPAAAGPKSGRPLQGQPPESTIARAAARRLASVTRGPQPPQVLQPSSGVSSSSSPTTIRNSRSARPALFSARNSTRYVPRWASEPLIRPVCASRLAWGLEYSASTGCSRNQHGWR